MSAILYYSNYCKYSKDLLVKLSRTKGKMIYILFALIKENNIKTVPYMLY